jgi:hypothetical protein
LSRNPQATTPSPTIPPDWDEWLRQAGDDAGFCQTSQWAHIHLALNNVEPCVVAIGRGGARRAGALMGVRSPAPGIGARVKRLVGVSNELTCIEGPVLAPDAQPADLQSLLAAIGDTARARHAGTITLGPAAPLARWSGQDEYRKVLDDAGYSHVPWSTAVVDITRSDAAMLAGFKQAARKGIRRCQEEGVHVTEIIGETAGEQFAAHYYELLSAPMPHAKASRNILTTPRPYRYFVAKNATAKVIAALGTYAFNGVATEIMSARSAETQLPAQDLIHFEIFRAHREAGDRWFNLAGFNPAPADGKEDGIKRFKEKWSGAVRDASTWVWVHPRLTRLKTLQARLGK